jgi:hypothetical protein
MFHRLIYLISSPDRQIKSPLLKWVDGCYTIQVTSLCQHGQVAFVILLRIIFKWSSARFTKVVTTAEDIVECEYQPGKCEKAYRLIILRNPLDVIQYFETNRHTGQRA